MRFSRTVWYLGAENFVVGTVNVPLRYSLKNSCQAPAVSVIWALSKEEPRKARLQLVFLMPSGAHTVSAQGIHTWRSRQASCRRQDLTCSLRAE